MNLYSLLIFIIPYVEARMFCDKSTPLEEGVWRQPLQHLDSGIVENKQNDAGEGKIYVYENYFPEHTIKYIHVDNLASKSCGPKATIKSGGVGSNSVLIVLQAGPDEEIRSVVEVWGTRNWRPPTKPPLPDLKNMKSRYLSQGGYRFIGENRYY